MCVYVCVLLRLLSSINTVHVFQSRQCAAIYWIFIQNRPRQISDRHLMQTMCSALKLFVNIHNS